MPIKEGLKEGRKGGRKEGKGKAEVSIPAESHRNELVTLLYKIREVLF